MCLVAGTLAASATAQVPTLDSLAGHWLGGDDIGNYPSVTNTQGAIRCGANLTEFYHGNFPPLSQAGSTAELRIDEKPVAAQRFRWFPYQVVRQAKLRDGLILQSTTRLAPDQNRILISLLVKNGGKKPVDHDLGVLHRGGFRRCDVVWDWGNRDVDPRDGFLTKAYNDYLKLSDPKSAAIATVRVAPPSESQDNLSTWHVSLNPGQSETFQIDYAVGRETALSVPFDPLFAQAKYDWEVRWRDAFAPHNKRYSGWLPTLVSKDEKVKRVYYLAIMSMLQMERTNLPKAKRCFVTAGPQWATTMEYFWDTSLFSTLYAWLEPKQFRANLERWLDVDVHSHYAIDYYSGQGVGPWYSANDLSLFTCYWNYATVTGDRPFLKQMRPKLHEWATYWKRLVHPGEHLADYGENGNILECGPEYVHMIPSLNGANVDLMRRDAQIESKFGSPTEAANLKAKAKDLAQHVLSMYQKGLGVWATKHRDGRTIVARHVYDYITIGQGMLPDLPNQIRKEMTGFFDNELIADGWIRAMSLSDDAASVSDRPDHGPKGSYCGWPAMATLTMCGFLQYHDALALLHNCEKASWQGPFPQSFELFRIPGAEDSPRNYVPRIAYRGGQDYNEPNGASFAEAIARGLFGVDYNLDGKLVVRDSGIARPFEGKLLNVPLGNGKMATLTSGKSGIHVDSTR